MSLPLEEQNMWVVFVNFLLKQRCREMFQNDAFSLSDLDEMDTVLDEKFLRCEELERVLDKFGGRDTLGTGGEGHEARAKGRRSRDSVPEQWEPLGRHRSF